jgi:hypothetical protein
LASVILPRPESDLKTELNFPVSVSNTVLSHIYQHYRRFWRKEPSQRTEDCKVAAMILQGQNPPPTTPNTCYDGAKVFKAAMYHSEA